ncbi:MAG: FtsX-like permease family protein [Bacteroides sp.]|nr:FtsX-like permease family protein [Bacteroides sp.]
MKSKLRQIYYDMRHQPVIAWVTFIATVLSVFLIIVVVMMQQIKIVPFAPESCRDKLLIAPYICIGEIENPEICSSGCMSYATAKQIYGGLDGVEHISYFTYWTDEAQVYAPQGDDMITRIYRKTDAGFFDVFDFTLIEGRYYTAEEAEAMMPLAVISESTARKTLGASPWVGRDLVIDCNNFTVVGVVRDVSTLAETAHGDVFTPTGPGDSDGLWGDYMGRIAAAMVVADDVDFQHIRDQVKARFSELDAQLAASDMQTNYFGSPFDQEIIATGMMGSNHAPDTESPRKMRMILYAILLLVPAINLSSMLHSRIRRRVSEIGVRRAFGCTRRRIIGDIITENFIVTLAGGIVGVTLGVIFAATYSGLYENDNNIGRGDTPVFSALLNWGTIVAALVICFILNILSASIPAWQASRMNVVDALNSK